MRLTQAYKACERVVRKAGSSFYYGMRLLPPAKRSAIYAVYAWSRACDDAVDEHQGQDARERLQRVWEMYQRAAGSGYASDPHPLVQALGDTIRRFHLPEEPFASMMEGMQMDMQLVRFRTYAELQHYCECVAGTVGRLCVHIFGYKHPDALKLAVDMGIALQLTNILRDLREDVERGRVYLPLEELAEAGYALEDLRNLRYTPAFEVLMQRQVARARQYYERAQRLFPLIEEDSLRCLHLLYAVYYELLQQIEANRFHVFDVRIRVSTPRKMQLFWGALWQKQTV
ncbi:phytoene desaturase [Alicyclobacillus cellulosilyticus]|uniref:Phytoene desaturase n=1 Tax=Alicyclobacillus cellulosilyticus TaxID=1003997 RepID=A0A917K470_9BACL|nr:presqualene diphosphate synthase HpnD [Alicyclobacillus cellulosilyticus]GGI98284.1 phytoene desaturase [Alicyclobacillus cellulosilyticus]